MLNRRGFLAGILSAAVAPAIIKAEILMPVKNIITYTGGYDVLNLDGTPYIGPAEFTWHQEKITVVTSTEFSELVATTFRKYQPQIVANVTRENALLKALQRGRSPRAT